MARTVTVTAHLVGLLLAAMVVVSASSAMAAALPSRCPAGTHELGWGESPCISDQRHISPSGHSIPYYATGKDARIPLRVETAVAGLIVGGLLIAGAFWNRKRPVLSIASAEVAAA